MPHVIARPAALARRMALSDRVAQAPLLPPLCLQGNMDSGVLFGSKEVITQRVQENAQQARDAGVRHIMNLGHGVMQVRAAHCTLCAVARTPRWQAAARRAMGGAAGPPAVQRGLMWRRTGGEGTSPLHPRPCLGLLPCRAPPRRTWHTSLRWPRLCATEAAVLLLPFPFHPSSPLATDAQRPRPHNASPLRAPRIGGGLLCTGFLIS